MMAIAAVIELDGTAATRQVNAFLGAADSRAWSRVRDQLIDKGLIESPGRGTIAFTMPGFAAYVRERHGSGVSSDRPLITRSPPSAPGE